MSDKVVIRQPIQLVMRQPQPVKMTLKQPALGSLAPVAISGDYNDLINTPAPGGAGTWGSITGEITDQTDLQATLDAKAAAAHSHGQSDVTGLTAALAGKEPVLT